MFKEGVTKKEVYAQVLEQAIALFEGQKNWVRVHYIFVSTIANDFLGLSNLSNTASLLYHGLRSLPSPIGDVNWAGFYVLDPKHPNQLILGPFHGQVACQTIQFGKGVCGAAAQSGVTQLVTDVEEFPGHIACDSASKSEIVVPIVQDGKVVAIIDIDCAELDGFDLEDQAALENLADILAKSCDF
ncbi:GAF domain-like protein [Lophiotrema nucula]|uniref:GAF domain-like protein n=1 Tax=Lophiotrema nucula TaxID=690887 RepID=A0A6A5ZT78_9PLEO|nr:GAF domain-like protein [Lophiotrema nucula]